MRAAVFIDMKKIEYKENYPDPSIGPDDALVKVHYCGICGSDITNFKEKLYQTPIIMGHEFSGEVIDIGKNIKNFKIGDKVLGINVKLDILKETLKGLGIFNNGGFAELVSVPKEFLFHAPRNYSLKSCTLVESFATAIRAVKLSKIDKNENIIIIGAGTLGLTTLSILLIKKRPNYIIAIEPHNFLRNKAIEMGANDSFPPSKSKIKKFIKKNGQPTYIFDCAGNQSSFNLALDLIDKGGTIVLEGIFKGAIKIPMLLINSKEICIKGIISHDRNDIIDSLTLFKKNKVKPEKLISKTIPLKDIQKAFLEFLASGDREFVKVIVKI
ncbi:MAG: zinc-dependent alcohol dehydrogenase [Candidatus Helarchaeota archaeon]